MRPARYRSTDTTQYGAAQETIEKSTQAKRPMLIDDTIGTARCDAMTTIHWTTSLWSMERPRAIGLPMIAIDRMKLAGQTVRSVVSSAISAHKPDITTRTPTCAHESAGTMSALPRTSSDSEKQTSRSALTCSALYIFSLLARAISSDVALKPGDFVAIAQNSQTTGLSPRQCKSIKEKDGVSEMDGGNEDSLLTDASSHARSLH